MTGSGGLDGTTLQLTHSPSTEYFGFQVGESANDRNCNYGAGGWFAYEGFLAVRPFGAEQEMFSLTSSAAKRSTTTAAIRNPRSLCRGIRRGLWRVIRSETYSREDTEGPEFVSPPQDMEVACTDYLAVPGHGH